MLPQAPRWAQLPCAISEMWEPLLLSCALFIPGLFALSQRSQILAFVQT